MSARISAPASRSASSEPAPALAHSPALRGRHVAPDGGLRRYRRNDRALALASSRRSSTELDRHLPLGVCLDSCHLRLRLRRDRPQGDGRPGRGARCRDRPRPAARPARERQRNQSSARTATGTRTSAEGLMGEGLGVFPPPGAPAPSVYLEVPGVNKQVRAPRRSRSCAICTPAGGIASEPGLRAKAGKDARKRSILCDVSSTGDVWELR